MIKIILNGYLWIVKPLLCLFVFCLLSCSGLKNMRANNLIIPQRVLQVAVQESDFEMFNQSIQELGLVAVDFRVVRTNMMVDREPEFYLTFLFADPSSFVSGCSVVMSTGIARRISYKFQE